MTPIPADALSGACRRTAITLAGLSSNDPARLAAMRTLRAKKPHSVGNYLSAEDYRWARAGRVLLGRRMVRTVWHVRILIRQGWRLQGDLNTPQLDT
jgi:hypothetical protein